MPVILYVYIIYNNYQKLRENSSAYEPFRLITVGVEITYLSIQQAEEKLHVLLNVLIFGAET